MGVTRHWFAVLLLAALACPCLAAEDLFTIPTRNGVTLSYLLDQDTSAAPKVVVVSFVGGLGAIGLVRSRNSMTTLPARVSTHRCRIRSRTR